jgi:deoxyhypusine synthase
VTVVVNLPEVVAVACLQVDVLVTTAGGVEEDLIKCLAPTFMGSFSMEGTQLRAKGLNRIGNLLVPNANYCKFEDWVIPILDQLVAEQKEQVQNQFWYLKWANIHQVHMHQPDFWNLVLVGIGYSVDPIKNDCATRQGNQPP